MLIVINTEELLDIITKKRTLHSPDLLADLAEYLHWCTVWMPQEIPKQERILDTKEFLRRSREKRDE